MVRVISPTFPEPITLPSILRTGDNSPIDPVVKHSSAVYISEIEIRTSSTNRLFARQRFITLRRVMPGRQLSACGVRTTPFFIKNKFVALVSDAVFEFPHENPPSTQSPFARSECYPSRRGITHRVSGRYPTFIAPTGSCARPPSSHSLGFNLVP